MDAAYLHLAVNHFPVVLAMVGTLVAVLGLFMQRRAVWLYAAASLTLAALAVYPVMLSGHAAEELVEKRWYASGEAIKAHEAAAEVATWVTVGAGLIAALAWFKAARPRHREDHFPVWLQFALVLSALASSGSLGWAAWQSGFIVHKAAAPPGTVPGVEAQPAGPPAGAAPAVP